MNFRAQLTSSQRRGSLKSLQGNVVGLNPMREEFSAKKKSLNLVRNWVKLGKVYIYEPSGQSGRSLSIFCDMKRLGVFLLPPGWDAGPSQGYLLIKFAGSHLYTWVERGTARVKCLGQGYNKMSPAWARTRTTRFRDEHTDHERPPRNQGS